MYFSDVEDVESPIQQVEIYRSPSEWNHPFDPSVIGQHVMFRFDFAWPVWGWRTEYSHASKIKQGGAYVEIKNAVDNMPPMVQPVGEILRRFPWGG